MIYPKPPRRITWFRRTPECARAGLRVAMDEPQNGVPVIKRFFAMDDGTDYLVVARDMAHAEQVLRDAQIDFGQWGKSYDECKADGDISWEEMTEQEVQAAKVDIDGVSTPLVDCDLGAWFCSEFYLGGIRDAGPLV